MNGPFQKRIVCQNQNKRKALHFRLLLTGRTLCYVIIDNVKQIILFLVASGAGAWGRVTSQSVRTRALGITIDDRLELETD